MDNTSDAATMDPGLSLEEKRLRRKAKNKVKKEDSKRAREEEIRRKLYEPKNQRVRLVNLDEMVRMPGFGVPNRTAFVPLLATSSDDFPCLGATKHKPSPEGENQRPLQIRRREASLGESEPSKMNNTSFEGTKHKNHDESRTETVTQSVASGQNVKPKRADPITVDLMSVLKKTTNATEKKVPPVAAKKKSLTQLSGNQLDSSNPERKKGKTRENPKLQKPSHLKAVILQDRKARLEVRAKEEMSTSSGCTGCVLAQGGGHLEACEEVVSSVTLEIEGAGDNTEDIAGLELRTGDAGVDVVGDGGVIETCGDDVESEENLAEKESVSLPEEIVQNMSALKVDVHKVTPTIHSRKFRDYCDHVPSPALDAAVSALITDIVKFQDRLYFTDPVKAHAKRRFVIGFRETKKYLCLKKLKLVIIAPDLEAARSKGGIDDTVAELKEMSRSQGVPCVFSVRRDMLRRLTNKSCAVKGISCVGVINFEGSQDNFHAIREMLPELRGRYRSLVEETASPTTEEATEEDKEEETEPLDVNKQVVATFLGKLTKELENN